MTKPKHPCTLAILTDCVTWSVVVDEVIVNAVCRLDHDVDLVDH